MMADNTEHRLLLTGTRNANDYVQYQINTDYVECIRWQYH